MTKKSRRRCNCIGAVETENHAPSTSKADFRLACLTSRSAALRPGGANTGPSRRKVNGILSVSGSGVLTWPPWYPSCGCCRVCGASVRKTAMARNIRILTCGFEGSLLVCLAWGLSDGILLVILPSSFIANFFLIEWEYFAVWRWLLG